MSPRIKYKDGFVGGRVGKRLEEQVNRFANENLKSKTDILEYCLNKFVTDMKCQQEFLKKWCKDGRHC